MRFRRKPTRYLTGGKALVSRAAKKLGASVLKMIDDQIYKEGLESCSPSKAIEIKSSITFNFAEPRNSENNEWLGLESVKVKKVTVLSVSI